MTLALVLLNTACELVTEFDRGKIPGESPDAGGSEAPDAGPGEDVPSCETPSDCPEPDSECVESICEEGICDTANVARGTACGEKGEEICNGKGTCVTVIPSCSDRLKNGEETAVDCGGDCEPCNNGSGCLKGNDCRSGFCREVADSDEGDAAAPSEPSGICAACRHDVNCADMENARCDTSLNNGTCVVD